MSGEQPVQDALTLLWRSLRTCPDHGMPDCSPLLNGCSLVNQNHVALSRVEQELARAGESDDALDRAYQERDDWKAEAARLREQVATRQYGKEALIAECEALRLDNERLREGLDDAHQAAITFEAEAERLREERDAAQTDRLPCGHPVSAAVTVDEGTSYCGECAPDRQDETCPCGYPGPEPCNGCPDGCRRRPAGVTGWDHIDRQDER